jgi:hypothetical protein
MNKIKEFAWWYGSIKAKYFFRSVAIRLSPLAVGFLFMYFHNKLIEPGEFTTWLSIVLLSMIAISFIFFFYLFWVVDFGSKYTDDSKNWRLVEHKAWKFAEENAEARAEMPKLIQTLRQTKDPSELNEFMDTWESPKEIKRKQKEKLLGELRSQKAHLKEVEDIMSGKKAEQIKKEIEKTEEEIRKI